MSSPSPLVRLLACLLAASAIISAGALDKLDKASTPEGWESERAMRAALSAETPQPPSQPHAVITAAAPAGKGDKLRFRQQTDAAPFLPLQNGGMYQLNRSVTFKSIVKQKQVTYVNPLIILSGTTMTQDGNIRRALPHNDV